MRTSNIIFLTEESKAFITASNIDKTRIINGVCCKVCVEWDGAVPEAIVRKQDARVIVKLCGHGASGTDTKWSSTFLVKIIIEQGNFTNKLKTQSVLIVKLP